MEIEIDIEGVVEYFRESHVGWVHEQIRRRQDDDQTVCIIVRVKSQDMELAFGTGACGGGGGRKRLNQKEKDALKLWQESGLSEQIIDSGRLVAFLQRLKTILG